ncbi:phage portal protein [Botrimarina sp.]|uniref:phage portal protein n=1 Tax=Botrimarina sp. TaxID=2795802 RepID=UPI0032ECB2A0
MNQRETTSTALESALAEAIASLWDGYVDPREAFQGDDGLYWAGVGGGAGLSGAAAPGLATLREECRRLALANEFAINGHENRISYVVGAGHVYRATIRKGIDAPFDLATDTQQVIDRFLATNAWHDRQQEIVRRVDRDGEAFLRFFTSPAGDTLVRFVEPEAVAAPVAASTDPRASHGVQTEAHDVESVVGYWINGELVDAADVQHRKANVDRNVKRGLPLYTPVRTNLRRAEKLLRNMSVVAEVQSAIALIRKHRSASRTGVEQFVASGATATQTARGGATRRVTEYGPGTILDAPAGLEYDFPATGIDAGAYVAILQAELRAIAARLVMPEFMFTSDASNANFASTMVAEGPAVKMFERLQSTMIEQDRAVLSRVIDTAVAAGRLSPDVHAAVEVQVTAPSLSVRNPLEETRVNEVAYRNGVLSAQTWSQRLGLDYDQEQQNRLYHTRPHS